MDRSPSAELVLADADARALLDVAEGSLRDHFAGRPPRPVDADGILATPAAAFVTLHVGGELNGCIGTFATDAPLGPTVARLALEAAFDDPRLPALRASDLDRLSIEVSVLSPRRPVVARTRTELLWSVRPGHHGLVIAAGRYRAVFLPTVWTQLPDPDDFLDALFRKAGLRSAPWPTDLHAEVFTTASVERELG